MHGATIKIDNDIKSKEFKTEDTSLKSFNNLPATTIRIMTNVLTVQEPRSHQDRFQL